MPLVCLIEEEREKNPKALSYLYQAVSMGVVTFLGKKFAGYVVGV